MTDVRFYFDLGSPYAYLSWERIATLLPQPVEWRPILLGGLFQLTGRSSWALGDYRRRQAGMADIERRAREYGLAPIRWPDPWPSNYLFAMRAVTYAFSVGRGPELVTEAYRAAFRDGVDLAIPGNVLEVAQRAGFDRDAVQAGAAVPAVKQALRAATDEAFQAGVIGVPTVAIDDELFWGDDRLLEAVGSLE